MSAQFQFQSSPRPRPNPGPKPADRSLRLPNHRNRLCLLLGLTTSLLLTCGCLPLISGVAWWAFTSAGNPANRPTAANAVQVATVPPRTTQAATPVAIIDLDALRNTVPQPQPAELDRQRQARRSHLQKTVRDLLCRKPTVFSKSA